MESRWLRVAALASLALLGAGCGSSGNGWHAFAKRTVSGTTVGAAGGSVDSPAAVEVKSRPTRPWRRR